MIQIWADLEPESRPLDASESKWKDGGHSVFMRKTGWAWDVGS